MGCSPQPSPIRRPSGLAAHPGLIVYGVRRGKVRFVGASRDRRALLLRRIRRAF
jgi:hypothetical protein